MFWLIFNFIFFTNLLIWPIAWASYPPDVVINEIMWMGSSLSTADEWLELKNTTDHEIDLTNWQITKKSNGSEVFMLTIPAGKNIPPGGFFLIANYPSDKSALNIAPGLIDTRLSLNNSDLQIKLYNGDWQNSLLMDTADDGDKAPLAGKNTSAEKASMERRQLPGDGQSSDNWQTAISKINLDADASEKGTPGAPNNSSPDSASSSASSNQPPVNFQSTTSAPPASSSPPSSSPETTNQTALADPPALTLNYSFSSEILINEFLPYPPSEQKEWVELFNPSDQEINLTNWAVADSLNNKQILPDGAKIKAKDFLVVYFSKPLFNNDGDQVKLIWPDGQTYRIVSYQKAPPRQSVGRDANGSWSWTTLPTPGAINIIQKIIAPISENINNEQAASDRNGGQSNFNKTALSAVKEESAVKTSDKTKEINLSDSQAPLPPENGSGQRLAPEAAIVKQLPKNSNQIKLIFTLIGVIALAFLGGLGLIYFKKRGSAF